MEQQEIRIRKFLMDVGIGPHLDGYHYLVAAIQIVHKALESDHVRKPIGEIYSEIADRFKITPSKVERSIRHAKEQIFDNPRITCNEYFCAMIDFETGDVTNGCFIFTLAEHLRFGDEDGNC